VSGADDSLIRVWDLRKNTFGLCTTINGHKSPIISLQFDHEKIVSGASDGVILLHSFS